MSSRLPTASFAVVVPVPRERGIAIRYAVAVGVTMVALAVAFPIAAYLQRVIFVLFWPAVIGAAWFGGVGPAILSSVLSVLLADYFLIGPPSHLAITSPEDLIPLAAFLFARQISQPLRKLDLASRALAAGDFEQRVEVDRDDEVGRLARSFSTMAERVGERDTQMRTLLANVSHDLKTPMTSITGYAQALTDGTAEPDDVHRVGTVIREEAEHVNRLLADLLYLGEIDAGQVLTRAEDVPLDAVVGRCVRRVEPGAQAKRLDVRVDVADDALVPNTDPDKLERALTNVLENATKFTPEGGDIEVRGWRENGRLPARVYCSVRNSGSAIPDDDLPRLFDRFFRGDRARRTASGSGLGLAISRQLLQLNGGDITARNDGDGHVVFTLSLPG